MARNLLPSKKYQQVKNERYTLIMFDENGRRLFTHSGLNLFDVVQVQMKCITPNRKTLIVNDYYLETRSRDKYAIDRDIKSYEDLFALKSAAMFPPEGAVVPK